jgi:hypothetical protein
VQSISSHTISLRWILVLSSHLRLRLPAVSFLLAYPPKPPICIPLLSLAFYMLYPWLFGRVQVMKLPTQSSETSCHFIPLSFKYSFCTLFSKTLSRPTCSSLNVRNQVSHPYKTAGKITFLYILIFMFFGSRWEEKRLKLANLVDLCHQTRNYSSVVPWLGSCTRIMLSCF